MATQIKAATLSATGRKIVPPRKSHKINLEQAKEMTRAYRNIRPEGTSLKAFKLGGTFNRDIFDDILAQPGCFGIRYYFANSPDVAPDNISDGILEANPTIVIVGVDRNGDDMLPGQGSVKKSKAALSASSGIIGEKSWPNQPHSGADNDLNSDR
ncbi:MAG: hypothetical protein WKF97_04745 [Chitinophagaceae bacterium]